MRWHPRRGPTDTIPSASLHPRTGGRKAAARIPTKCFTSHLSLKSNSAKIGHKKFSKHLCIRTCFEHKFQKTIKDVVSPVQFFHTSKNYCAVCTSPPTASLWPVSWVTRIKSELLYEPYFFKIQLLELKGTNFTHFFTIKKLRWVLNSRASHI
jgi:hypothetical protein